MKVSSYLNRRKFQSPYYYSYTNDKIFGINWEWEWDEDLRGDLIIRDLTPICPKCSYELRMKEKSSPGRSVFDDFDKLDFYCDSCKFKYTQDFNKKVCFDKVKKEIKKIVRVKYKK